MKKLLDFHVSELPESWSRSRGKQRRFKPLAMRAWQKFLRRIAAEEMDIAENSDLWPHDGPLFVSIQAMFPSMQMLNACGQDGDNIVKAILDAFNGMLWPDDKIRYVRGHSFKASVAQSKEWKGTHVTVYLLP